MVLDRQGVLVRELLVFDEEGVFGEAVEDGLADRRHDSVVLRREALLILVVAQVAADLGIRVLLALVVGHNIPRHPDRLEVRVRVQKLGALRNRLRLRGLLLLRLRLLRESLPDFCDRVRLLLLNLLLFLVDDLDVLSLARARTRCSSSGPVLLALPQVCGVVHRRFLLVFARILLQLLVPKLFVGRHEFAELLGPISSVFTFIERERILNL